MSNKNTTHHWITFHNVQTCRHCGVIKRFRGKNSPCRGGGFNEVMQREHIAAESLPKEAGRDVPTAIGAASAG